ncbi:MAG: MerR family transcriptional regulator [Chlorobi bacterium]|nr:MerR family transcriptional regulator [Chlorobiota bacterium]
MAQKIYFKIGDVAARFGVNPSLIRYWEKQFDFIRPKKSEKGTRLYTRKDMDHFEIIYHLIKEKGMTVKGVKEYLEKHKKQESVEKLEVINTLKRMRQLLLDVKEVLDNRAEV